MKVLITDDTLRTLRPADDQAQLVAYDSKLSGLAVVVGKEGTTFVAIKRVGAKVHREKLGRWKGRGGEMSVSEARKEAVKRIGKLEGREVTPGKTKRASKSGPTLAEACTRYLAKLAKIARQSSIDTVEREIADRGAENREGSYLLDWLDRPLASIVGKDCRSAHEKLTRDHGPHVANRVMREFRAIWNHLGDEVSAGVIEGLDIWPANPTRAVVWNTKKGTPGYVERRREPIAWSDFPAWHAEVMAIANPVRRDLHLIACWTGIRRGDLVSIRWEHVNTTDEPIASRVWNGHKFEKRDIPPMTMLRPVPKGGADRAFLVPLSTEIARILDGRRINNATLGRNDNGWVFPTTALKSDKEKRHACYVCRDLGMPPHEKGATIHTTEPKEDSAVLVSPHRLRDTYTTALADLKDPPLSPYAIDVLTNHRPPRGSVTAGYIGELDLGDSQERVSKFLLGKIVAALPHGKRGK